MGHFRTVEIGPIIGLQNHFQRCVVERIFLFIFSTVVCLNRDFAVKAPFLYFRVRACNSFGKLNKQTRTEQQGDTKINFLYRDVY